MPTEAELGAACQQVLEMFVGVCGAPDDLDVIAAANSALSELETLLIAAAG